MVATLALASSVIDFTHNCGLSMLPNCICPMSDATAATTTATCEEEQKKLHIKLNIKLRGELCVLRTGTGRNMWPVLNIPTMRQGSITSSFVSFGLCGTLRPSYSSMATFLRKVPALMCLCEFGLSYVATVALAAGQTFSKSDSPTFGNEENKFPFHWLIA